MHSSSLVCRHFWTGRFADGHMYGCFRNPLADATGISRVNVGGNSEGSGEGGRSMSRGALSAGYRAAAASGLRVQNGFCKKCREAKPVRAHHCHVCNQCIVNVRYNWTSAYAAQPSFPMHFPAPILPRVALLSLRVFRPSRGNAYVLLRVDCGACPTACIRRSFPYFVQCKKK